MKKKILAAAIAAICLGGCTEKPTEAEPKKSHAASPVAEQKTVIAAKAEKVPPVEEVEAATTEVAEVIAEKVMRETDDGLPLEHTHTKKVDHLSRAIALKESGDFDGALTEARRAIFDEPANDQALRFIARAAQLVGQKEYVAAAWGRIAKLNQGDANALVQYSRALVNTGDFEGAVKIAKEAVAVDATSAEPHQAMGRAYLAAGNLQEAIDSFHKAIELDPEHGYAMNNLGFAYLRANQNANAAFILEKAAELLPYVAYVQNNLGVALERMGRNEEAKAAYQKAMDLSPKYVKARINSARISKVAKVSDDVPVDAAPIPVDQTTDVPDMFEEQ